MLKWFDKHTFLSCFNVFHNKQEVRNRNDRKDTYKKKEKIEIIPNIVSILFEIEKCKSLLISTSNRYGANILCICNLFKIFFKTCFFIIWNVLQLLFQSILLMQLVSSTQNMLKTHTYLMCAKWKMHVSPSLFVYITFHVSVSFGCYNK